jgi:hypothetical protein
MDYLVAKTRGRQSGYALVLSNKTVFDEIPDFSNTRAYDDDYKLQEGEYFVLENFSSKEYCPEFVNSDFVAANYSFLARKKYEKINHIISIQENEGKHFFIFQNITSSYIYKKYKALSWGGITRQTEQAQLIEEEGLLVIKEHPDCYFCREDDKLYFTKLSSITNIFRGINELYREATDEEVTAFLGLDIVNTQEGFGVEKVKTQNRRKIKEAMERYTHFNEEKKNKLPFYVSNYCPSLFDSHSRKFNIKEEKDLTELLNIINQRYYTTELDAEKMLANSVSNVE